MKHVFSIPRAHVLIHVNTHKLTIHTYGIYNDITKHKQPEATVINVNRLQMIVTVNLNKKVHIILLVRI